MPAGNGGGPMMWPAADRERYGRDGLRYPSDLTDAEWALIAPLIRPAKRGGRQRSVLVREVMNGLLYALETGCQWRHLPRDLPPRSTAHSYLQRWDWDGTLEAVHHHLYVACREQAGKEASPTAAILDSKSVKAAEKGAHRSTRSVSMRARRSRVSSTTSSSTRSDCC
jgi:transposase